MIRQFVSNYVAELKRAIDLIPLDKLELTINTLIDAYETGHSVFIMGNGGSGATASHFVCDLNKGTQRGLSKRMRCICLNDNMPSILAYANDLSYDDIFTGQLENFLEKEDVVIVLSASGNSPNVLKAIQYANQKSAHTIAFTGFKGGQAATLAKISIVIPAEDVQKIEDIHLILAHMILQIFQKKTGN
jgi:D-sedoheptulose 7-phosphate isomerase